MLRLLWLVVEACLVWVPQKTHDGQSSGPMGANLSGGVAANVRGSDVALASPLSALTSASLDADADAEADSKGKVHAAATLTEGFAEQLFQESLALANESLQGRFIREMAAGTLPREVFSRYLAQDNLYLFKYARAYAVLAAKTETNRDFAWLSQQAQAFVREHGAEGNASVVTERDFLREALPVTRAYAELLLSTAWREELVVGLAAVVPCQRLYDWLFSSLWASGQVRPGNPYEAFVRQYAAPENHRLTAQLQALLDAQASRAVANAGARASAGARAGAAALLKRARTRYRDALRLEAAFFAQAFSAATAPSPVPTQAPGLTPSFSSGAQEVGVPLAVHSRRRWF